MLVMTTQSVLLLACALPGPPDAVRAPSAFVSSRIQRRVVKQFSFEKEASNFSNVPMNWRPLPRPGFLRHNEAAFDEAVGRTSPPSLKMTFDRGGVGAWYRAKDIDVHPANDYRVVAWVRPHKLGAARAYITAFFLDHAYRKIRSSERRSRWIRGPRSDEPWTEIAVELTGGVGDSLGST